MPQLAQDVADKIVALRGVYGWGAGRIRRQFQADQHAAPPSEKAILLCLRRWRNGKDPRGGKRGPTRLTHQHWKLLKAELDRNPRLIVEEQIAFLDDRTSARYTKPAIFLCLRTHKYTWKHLSYRARQKEFGVRQDYLFATKDTQNFDPELCVFIDEAHFNKQVDRVYGWGPEGVELGVSRLFGDKHSYSLLAACSTAGFIQPASVLLDSSEMGINANRVEAWARTCLLPQLGNWDRREPRSIVVADNATVHTPRLVALVESVGAKFIFLPPYSPEQVPAPWFGCVTPALASARPP